MWMTSTVGNSNRSIAVLPDEISIITIKTQQNVTLVETNNVQRINVSGTSCSFCKF